MAFDDKNKWVIIEVNEVDDKVEVFFAPQTLKLRAGWIGNIIWYVFTPGWELSQTDGVCFDAASAFNGSPQPDATRARCWSTPASNDRTGTFPYTVALHRLGDRSTLEVRSDPVVENDPPSPGLFQNLRPARRREGSRRQNAS